MPEGPLAVYIDDVVRLRKPHPCGSFEWTVVRLGADIGLRCHGCGHKVLLPRRTLEKRLKGFLARGPGYDDTAGPAGAKGKTDPSSSSRTILPDAVVVEPETVAG